MTESNPNPSPNFQPLHDYVLVVRQKQATVTTSGLHIPGSAADPRKGTLARVLAAGPGKRHPDTGVRMPMQVRVGNMVVIARHQNTSAEVAVSSLPLELREGWGVDGGDVLLMLRETDLLAVLAADDETLEEVPGEVTADADEAFDGNRFAMYDGFAIYENGEQLRRVELAGSPVRPPRVGPGDHELRRTEADDTTAIHGNAGRLIEESRHVMVDTGSEKYRRDELAEERTRRYTKEDGSHK